MFFDPQFNDPHFLEHMKNDHKKMINHFQPDAVLYGVGDAFAPFVDTGSPEITHVLSDTAKQTSSHLKTIAFGPFATTHPSIDLSLNEPLSHLTLDKTIKFLGLPVNFQDPQIISLSPNLEIDYFSPVISAQDFDTLWLSQGCRYNCSFCRVPAFNSRQIMKKNVSAVIDEMKYRSKNLGVTNFYFTDPTFNDQNKFVEEFCLKLISENLNLKWKAEARIDRINVKTLGLMKRAGCSILKFGIEAMNDERLKFLNKGFNVKQVIENFKLIESSSIKTVVYILLGHPDYTEEKYMEEYELFKSLRANYYTVSILNPAPFSKIDREQTYSFINHFGTSHLSQKAANFWKIPTRVLEKFYQLELHNGREDRQLRSFKNFELGNIPKTTIQL